MTVSVNWHPLPDSNQYLQSQSLPSKAGLVWTVGFEPDNPSLPRRVLYGAAAYRLFHLKQAGDLEQGQAFTFDPVTGIIAPCK